LANYEFFFEFPEFLVTLLSLRLREVDHIIDPPTLYTGWFRAGQRHTNRGKQISTKRTIGGKWGMRRGRKANEWVMSHRLHVHGKGESSSIEIITKGVWVTGVDVG
jgi:hypothetical protein